MQLDIIYGDRDVSGAKCAKTPKSRRRKPRQSWELHIDVFLENSLYISCIYFIPSNILIWYAYICTLFLRFLQFISTKMALIYFIWNSWAVAPWLLMTWSQAKLSTKTGWYVFVGVATGGPSSRWYQVWIFFWVIGIKIPSRISVFFNTDAGVAIFVSTHLCGKTMNIHRSTRLAQVEISYLKGASQYHDGIVNDNKQPPFFTDSMIDPSWETEFEEWVLTHHR